jgi:RNA-directed DNA polymerase
MDVNGKSDMDVVPRKGPNKTMLNVAEALEERSVTKGKADQPTVTQTQCWGETLSGLARIRKAAEKGKGIRFTCLMHHITPEQLEQSYYKLKRQAATGVDQITWAEYQQDLASRLDSLHHRVQSGTYKALPSRRVWIRKNDKGWRPLGIASLEDKIVQQAVTEILTQIYETDFLGFSYGFRPRRGQHNALDALSVGIKIRKIGWILDADIKSFFDTVDHSWMMKFLEHRIADQRMLRLIRKWLKAGVFEDGQWKETNEGTPQGAVISPLLANVYLHYVFDLWMRKWRKLKRGDIIVVRYADDIVIGFQHQRDAEAFKRELSDRMSRFNLKLNGEKTRLIRFGRFAAMQRSERDQGKPETFNYLGFTHICGRQQSNGKFITIRKSISQRQKAKLVVVKEELKYRRHESIPEQGAWLRSVVQGYFNYHAVPGNMAAMAAFRYRVCQLWYRSLRRRSHKARCLNWDRMARLVDKWIPNPRILHPYPEQRLVVRT